MHISHGQNSLRRDASGIIGAPNTKVGPCTAAVLEAPGYGAESVLTD